MKKKLVSIVLALTLSASVLVLTACSNSASGSLSFEDAYGYSAISAISLLKDGGDDAQSASAIVGQENENNSQKMQNVGTEIQNVDKKLNYMGLSFANGSNYAPSSEEELEILLSNLAIAENTIRGEIVKSELIASDRAEYEYHYTLTAADVSGESNVYSFYYNVVRENRYENESYFKGIVILDGTEYGMTGERESEDGEEEYKFVVSLDTDNYVVIEQESSRREKEFKYSTYEKGRCVFESSVEYESSLFGGREICFSTESAGAELEYKYSFFEMGGTSYVKIETERGGVEYSYLVKSTLGADGEPIYEFVDSKLFNKFNEWDEKYD